METNRVSTVNARYCGYSNRTGKRRTIHAEMAACWKVPKRILKNSTIIVIRADIRKSNPCKDCEKVLKKLGLRKVYHS